MRELIVEQAQAGQRLDKYLQKYMSEAPKSFFYKMLRKKNITCNQKKCDGSERLLEGDVIRLFLSEETIEGFRRKKESFAAYPSMALSILYEDSHVLFLNKPAGVLSQKAEKNDVSMVEGIISYLLKNQTVTEESLRSFRPSVCNRLDRNTSGIITAGKTPEGARALSALFKERSMKKYYLCLVSGKIKEKKQLHGWLLKYERTNQVAILKEETAGSSEIHTAYEPLAWGTDLTLLKVKLITGKSHQIRAHLSSIGHPIVGDRKYGSPAVNEKFRKTYGLQHQFLHAWYLSFPELSGTLSPLSGKCIKAPLPKPLAAILEGEHIKRKGAL